MAGNADDPLDSSNVAFQQLQLPATHGWLSQGWVQVKDVHADVSAFHKWTTVCRTTPVSSEIFR
jgi:hypothetical protein